MRPVSRRTARQRVDPVAQRGARDVLLDPSGDVGHLYDAKTTPHMFIINKDGLLQYLLQYMGGADSIASTRVDDLARAEPYTRNALTAIAAGQPAPHPITRPYGCTVKYAA